MRDELSYISRTKEWLEFESKKSEAARLLNENIDLLLKNFFQFIKKKHFNEEEKEDMFSHVVLKLLRAFERFDESRGVKLATFATVSIRGELRKYIRDKSKESGISRGREKPCASNLSWEHIFGHNTHYGIAHENDPADIACSKVFLEQLLRPLNNEERELIKACFGGEKSQAEIAREMKVSQMQISRLMRRALRKIREEPSFQRYKKD